MSVRSFFVISIILFVSSITAFLNLRNDTTWRYNAALIGMLLLGMLFIIGVFALIRQRKG